VQCGGRVRISLTGEGQVSGTGLEAALTGGLKVGCVWNSIEAPV
jgi:hypothetical protein